MALHNTHMLKERKNKTVLTQCGKYVDWATVWRSDVTCPDCLEHLGTPLEHKRTVPLEQPLGTVNDDE